MCGRFGLAVPFATLAKLLRAEPVTPEEWGPDFSIAPTDPAPVLWIDDAGARRLDLYRWGLVPFWSADARGAARMINARADSVATKPAFRDALKERRLLVPASGWYEWTRRAGAPKAEKPQPHWIHEPGGALTLFAGLGAAWKDPASGARLHTFTIVTTEAAPATRALHERMPVVLGPEAQAAWLDPRTPVAALTALLVPYAGPLAHHPVDKRVNDVRVADGPELIGPVSDGAA